jgi:hypothetical protein
MISKFDIVGSIAAEREYQQSRWGNEADDTVNEPNDFVAYINHYSTRWFPGGFTPYTPETVDAFRKSMIKVAAIAVAAVESIDRQREDAGHCFYEAGHREGVGKQLRLAASND